MLSHNCPPHGCCSLHCSSERQAPLIMHLRSLNNDTKNIFIWLLAEREEGSACCGDWSNKGAVGTTGTMEQIFGFYPPRLWVSVFFASGVVSLYRVGGNWQLGALCLIIFLNSNSFMSCANTQDAESGKSKPKSQNINKNYSKYICKGGPAYPDKEILHQCSAQFTLISQFRS